MHKKNCLLIFYILYIFSVTNSCLAQTINDAGALNVHDMNFIKEQEQLKIRDQHLIKLNETKKNQENEQNKETTDIKPIAQEKAKIEEYQTKGVYVEQVEFSPSKILSAEEIEKFKNKLIGKNLFIKDIDNIVEEINTLYLEKGFVTAKAFLPEQIIENGIIKIDLIEGKVGRLNITGNKWTRNIYIKQRISKKEGELFDITTLEKDIVKFNRYNEDVKINANLTKGNEFSTTDINLNVTENTPFHITGLFDNAGRSTIGLLRGGVMVSDDSLLGFRDKLSSGVYLSKNSTTPFVDYNVPINKHDGKLGFLFSSSFSEIAQGNYSMFDITSRSYNYSVYFNQPVIRKPAFELNSNSSWTFKRAVTAFDKVDISTDKISGFQQSLNGRYDTKKGIWYGTQDLYLGTLFKETKNTYTYFKYSGDIIRLHDFGHGIIGQLRGMYQYIPQNVIPYADQFQSGGISTVRGYSEGVLIGKTGYLLSAELLFPVLPQKITIYKDKKIPFLGKYVKGVIFADHAGVFPFKGEGPGVEGVKSDDYLIGLGPGLRINLPADLTARLYFGFPIGCNRHESIRKTSRFHFELSLSPDFDKILNLRFGKKEAL